MTLCSASLPVPGTIPGLVPGSAAEAQWYQQQLAFIAANGRKRRSTDCTGCDGSPFRRKRSTDCTGCDGTNYRKRRSLPVPGTIPGLVPGSAAEAYWYQAQLSALAAGRRKRSLPVPGTIPGLVP